MARIGVLYPPLIFDNGGNTDIAPVVIIDPVQLGLNPGDTVKVCLEPNTENAFPGGCVETTVPSIPRQFAVPIKVSTKLDPTIAPSGTLANISIYRVKDNNEYLIAIYPTCVVPTQGFVYFTTDTSRYILVIFVVSAANILTVSQQGSSYKPGNVFVVGPLYILSTEDTNPVQVPVPPQFYILTSLVTSCHVFYEIVLIDKETGRPVRTRIYTAEEFYNTFSKYINSTVRGDDFADTMLRIYQLIVKTSPDIVTDTIMALSVYGVIRSVTQESDGKYRIVLEVPHGIAQFGESIAILALIGIGVAGACFLEWCRVREIEAEAEKVKYLSQMYTAMADNLVNYVRAVLKSNIPSAEKVRLITDSNPFLLALHEMKISSQQQKTSTLQEIEKILTWIIIGAIIVIILKYLLR